MNFSFLLVIFEESCAYEIRLGHKRAYLFIAIIWNNYFNSYVYTNGKMLRTSSVDAQIGVAELNIMLLTMRPR